METKIGEIHSDYGIKGVFFGNMSKLAEYGIDNTEKLKRLCEAIQWAIAGAVGNIWHEAMMAGKEDADTKH